ncbi:putative ankyrin repeat domain-containing protein 45 [Apostichopus japonicus]|uniref:Putative ankyrin repeat domain-containing protein 45 n=1 Tax=Stichopus japonicus TaxID=307972 RepID=A0A2G8JN11_STIJA|nr:putative ankyrin repeat domain-containing protein 45 [Apostichopus japonicus]
MMKFLMRKDRARYPEPAIGKSPLDMACILGREDIVRELLANEVKYDATSVSEARKDLKNLITEIKEIIDDPQKLQGRLAKDEKMIAVNACADKQEWLDTNNSASIKEVHRQFKELTGILEPIQAKLAEPRKYKSSHNNVTSNRS